MDFETLPTMLEPLWSRFCSYTGLIFSFEVLILPTRAIGAARLLRPECDDCISI